MSTSTNNTCITLGQCTSPTNLPSYIDTAACLCGILDAASSLPNNGLQTEMWRCIGNASANVKSGSNGKWYNTTLPSEELSGINEAQNWAQNPPDLSQAYVLQNENGNMVYEKLGSGGSPELIGADTDCTGTNDTELSAMYYDRGNGSSSTTTSSLTSSGSATSSASGTANSASSTTASSTTTSATGATSAGSTSASASTPKATSASAAAPFSLSSALLVGMVVAPLVSLLM